MVLILLAVDCFSSVPLLEKVGIEGAVQDFPADVGISISLVANDLEECGTSASRLAKDKYHLSRLGHTLEVLQDVELLALLAYSEDAFGGCVDVEERYEGIGEGRGKVLYTTWKGKLNVSSRSNITYQCQKPSDHPTPLRCALT